MVLEGSELQKNETSPNLGSVVYASRDRQGERERERERERQLRDGEGAKGLLECHGMLWASGALRV